MDFNIIFQLRTKKFWWMDVIFYFVISLLVATVLCYGVFLIKNAIQRRQINEQKEALKTVGTEQQKIRENQVIGYQKKINDFAGIFKNHQFASNAFAFMQTQTMPSTWFRQFILDRKNSGIQLTGETEDLETLGRQVASFSKNEYVKDVGSISTTMSESSRSQFSFSLSLNPKIFTYIEDMAAILEPKVEEQVEEENPSQNEPETLLSSEKLITSFHLKLNPAIIGTIDQKNYTINFSVPFGTNVKGVATDIVVSPKAKIVPASNEIQDFTNSITYNVTAEDGSVQPYKVAVNILPKVETAKSKMGWIAIIVGVLILIVGAISGFLVWRKMKSKKSNI